MKLSELNLIHSHFNAFSVVADKSYVEPTENQVSPYPEISTDDIFAKVELGTPDEAGVKQYVVTLGVGTTKTDKEPNPLPYRFAAQIEGFFTISSDDTPDIQERITVVNGASMLYGIVKEHLLTITMRHRNGPLLLPSLDFRALSPSKDPPASAEKQKKRAQKKKIS